MPIALPPYIQRGKRAMSKQRRLKQSGSLKDRLSAFAEDMREKAAQPTHGAERDDLLRRARQAGLRMIRASGPFFLRSAEIS